MSGKDEEDVVGGGSGSTKIVKTNGPKSSNDNGRAEDSFQAPLDPLYKSKPGLARLDELLTNLPINPDFKGVEENVDSILGDSAKNKSKKLEKLTETGQESRLQMAAYCKLAIRAIRQDSNIQGAFEYLAKAGEVDAGTDNPLPGLIESKIRTEISVVNVKEGSLRVVGSILRAAPLSRYAQLALDQVEENTVSFKLETPIRPSRSLVSQVDVGGLALFRRASPDRELIFREEAVLKYYQRLNRHLSDEAAALLQVPHVIGSVDVLNSSMRALYTQDISGDDVARVLDEIRFSAEQLKKAQTRQSAIFINNSKNTLTIILTSAVKQCAYALACGPVGLADEIDEPFTRYYNERINSRLSV